MATVERRAGQVWPARDCPAIDADRMSLQTGASVPVPAPEQDCPARFGNTDIFGGSWADPTTP